MEKEKLKSVLESLLFVNGDTITVSHLAKIVACDTKEVQEAIKSLSEDYKGRKGGLMLVEKEDRVQLVTNPDNSQYVQELIKIELYGNLSKTSLETLAIIAYKEPISRSEIDAIRGVNSNFILRNLLIRGLIERVDNPHDSRGYMYKLSVNFLKKLGIGSVKDLPDFEEFSKNEKIGALSKTVEKSELGDENNKNISLDNKDAGDNKNTK